MTRSGNGPSEDAVRGQLREERERVADDSSAQGASGADSAEHDRDDAVVEVEAARSAEARMATESASAVEAADAATRGDEPDQGEADEGGVEATGEEDLRAERDRYLDLAKRAQADFENYRKRAAKDAAAAGTRAKAGLVRELLPVVDNLERALASAPEGDPLLEGVKLVHGELVAVLERSGVTGFDPSGEAFDPNQHEALTTRPADGTDPGVVVDVVEKGYRLNETVLRPARVVVSA
jgi:molecular chaperone GrpE